MTRGKIAYRERAQQIHDFSKLRFKYNITPTDIDGSLDFAHGRLLIFIESKLSGTEIKLGQMNHLKYIVRDHKSAAIAIIVEHNVYDASEDVDESKSIVKEYYFNRDKKFKKEQSLYDFICEVLKSQGLEEYVLPENR